MAVVLCNNENALSFVVLEQDGGGWKINPNSSSGIRVYTVDNSLVTVGKASDQKHMIIFVNDLLSNFSKSSLPVIQDNQM